MMLRQGKHASIQKYSEAFQNQVTVLEQATSGHTTGTKLVNAKLENILTITAKNPATDNQITDANEKALEIYLAIIYIMGADRSRFGKYVEDL